MTSSNRNRSLALFNLSQLSRALASIHNLWFGSYSRGSLTSFFSNTLINNQILSGMSIFWFHLVLLIKSLRLWFGNNIIVQIISLWIIWMRNLMGIIYIFFSMIIKNEVWSKRRIYKIFIFDSFIIRRLFSKVFNLCSFEGGFSVNLRRVLKKFLVSNQVSWLHIIKIFNLNSKMVNSYKQKFEKNFANK